MISKTILGVAIVIAVAAAVPAPAPAWPAPAWPAPGAVNPWLPPWVSAMPWFPQWTPCTAVGPTCLDCTNKLVCTKVGGLQRACTDPALPYCNLGECSATPSAECAPPPAPPAGPAKPTPRPGTSTTNMFAYK